MTGGELSDDLDILPSMKSFTRDREFQMREQGAKPGNEKESAVSGVAAPVNK